MTMTSEQIAASLTPGRGRANGFCSCPLHTLFPMRISELVTPTFIDLQAACDLIGKDTYGKPHWTPETIDPCNPVVQAFGRHRRAVLAALDKGAGE